ncbi:MAG: OmpH family outer membrane protein [Candidatus Omnitrophica bacterium]|nr:OmpH family outer membrane protein [Candidatus Omnitrophota bacterium]
MRMNKCTVVAAVCLISLSTVLAAKDLKVGVVDVEKVYAAYEKAKASAAEIQTERKSKQDELAKKREELKALREDYDKRKDKMTEAEKKEMEKKIADKSREILAFTNVSNQELQKKNQELTRARLDEIAKVIQDYATKNKYDLIIDKKSLPYFSSAYNVSDDIIKALNAK